MREPVAAKIVVVEDDAAVLRMMTQVLSQDFLVFSSASAEEALEVLKKERVQAVVADQMLPGMLGVALLRRVSALQPEAARILRPGGRLSFLGNSVLLMLTTPIDDEDAPASEQLQRPLFGMYRFAREDGAVEFHLPHGEKLRLLRDSGFEVEDLIEVEIAEDATTRYPFVSAEWARRWPAEEVWKARKR